MIAVTVAGLVVFFSLDYFRKEAYAENPWKDYSTYIHARSLIMDYYRWPAYGGNEDFWESLNISKEEYDCLNMYGVLPDMNAGKIIEISKFAEDTYHITLENHLKSCRDLLFAAAQSESCRIANIVLLMSAIVLINIFVRSDKIGRVAIALCVAVVIAELAYLLWRGRFPSRILFCVDWMCISAICGICLKNSAVGRNISRVVYKLFLISCFSLLFLSIPKMRSSVENYKRNLGLYKEEISYVEEYPDRFFVVLTNTFITCKQFTVHDIDLGMENTTGTYGWSTFSPWNEKKLKENGIGRENNMFLQDIVYMMTVDLTNADKLNKYFKSEGYIDGDYIVTEEKIFS